MLQRKIFIFIIFMLSGTVAYSSVAPNQIKSNEVEFIQPDKILSQYYQAVDRGELVVFGIHLDRSMLIPVHVNYIYLLNTEIPRVKVYARLKKPMRIPEQGNNTFTAICAYIDMFGVIVETEAHIFLD